MKNTVKSVIAVGMLIASMLISGCVKPPTPAEIEKTIKATATSAVCDITAVTVSKVTPSKEKGVFDVETEMEVKFNQDIDELAKGLQHAALDRSLPTDQIAEITAELTMYSVQFGQFKKGESKKIKIAGTVTRDEKGTLIFKRI